MRADDRCQLVGVIASPAELTAGGRLRSLPDFFEIRLDRLPRLERENLASLKSPLILTARPPREGGKFSTAVRRKLFERFLPVAAAIDLEFRSLATLRDVWKEARVQGKLRLCSVHHFAGTPSLPLMHRQFERAHAAGADVFKIVARADSVADFSRLRDFLTSHPRKVCVMAIGKFGARSRREFPALGSRLVYAPVLRPFHAGQLSLAELRRAFSRSGNVLSR